MKNRELVSGLLIFVLLVSAGCGILSGGDGDEPDPPDPPDEDTTPPSSPASVEGTSGDEIVELSWSANSESDLDGYNLYRSQSSFSDVSDMDPVNGSSLISGEVYTDNGLDNGTTYYYRLTAVDEDDNESDLSAEVEVTPFSGPPDRPKR